MIEWVRQKSLIFDLWSWCRVGCSGYDSCMLETSPVYEDDEHKPNRHICTDRLNKKPNFVKSVNI